MTRTLWAVNTPQFQCLFPKNLPGWPQKPPETSHLAKIHMFFLPRSHDIWIKESTPHWLGITFLGDMDQVWIQHDTKVLQNMTDFGKKSGDVEDVHILYPSTGVAMELIFKKDFFPWEFSNRFHQQQKNKPSTYPQKMPISLAQISLGCSENFFPPLIFKSQRGGVRFLQGCRFVVRAPKHRDAKNFFAHQLQARSHRHALRQCLDDSIPEAGNQRRPAGCCRTIQFKINDKCIWLYHSWAPKIYDGFWNDKFVFRILLCPSFGNRLLSFCLYLVSLTIIFAHLRPIKSSSAWG